MDNTITFPPQQLSFTSKGKEWRKKCVDWADSKTFYNYSLVRKSIIHKKINYDLINGKLHMSDLESIINPDSVEAGYIPERIQHYPIINSKLNVLRGEESKRVFDFKVIVTNPTAITEKEEAKKNQIFQQLQAIIEDPNISEEQYNEELEKLNYHYMYEWQDLREVRANYLLNHYVKEYNIPLIFNNGFMDAMTVAEEIYQCDIVGGEPIIEKLNPLKVRVFRSGFSTKIEDADIVVIEDYWSPGKIIDTFHEVLNKEDIKYIENIPIYEGSTRDSMDNIDERASFILADTTDMPMTGDVYFDPFSLFSDTAIGSKLYHDRAGNIRVMRVYWKSRRKIKRIKSYHPETGEETYAFYPETYELRKDLGEEEQTFWINEAWEGTKIGAQIYVNMRPRLVQYNRLSNPSRCHFGIVGSIYNFNDSKPFSLVDMMKPYSYLYDVIHDRLNKAIAANWGKILPLDLAQVPKGWDVEKWMYYAKVNHIAVVDSFKEGNIGAATGKLAGAMQQSRGVLDAETGNYIQQHINLLDFIKMEMAEVAGISKQREGQVSNRETVGGVERATLQSSHITEWLFFTHEDVKRRALECFLETAKIALKGRSKKFSYILSDSTERITDIDGDEFAEADYGLVVDNSSSTQNLNQKLDMLAQAALQNQTLSFSAIMKLYSTVSMAEKMRLIERDEQAIQDRQAQAQQQQLEAQQQQAEMQAAMKQEELDRQDARNMRDNETKILIAQINSQAEENFLMAKLADKEGTEEPVYSQEAKEKLREQIREFDNKLKLDRDKFEHEKTISKSKLEVEKIKARKTNTIR